MKAYLLELLMAIGIILDKAQNVLELLTISKIKSYFIHVLSY